MTQIPITTGKADSQEKGVSIHATTSSSVSIDNRHFYCTLPKYFQKKSNLRERLYSNRNMSNDLEKLSIKVICIGQTLTFNSILKLEIIGLSNV